MQLPQRHRRTRVGFNMTPMIDIVFLLIIFFLVSSHLAKQESQMPLPLPTAKSDQQAEDDVPRVIVNIRESGEVLLTGQTIDPPQLTERLARQRIARGAEGRDLEVRIRSDRRVPYRFVAPVLRACAASGIWNVKFAVVRPEDAR